MKKIKARDLQGLDANEEYKEYILFENSSELEDKHLELDALSTVITFDRMRDTGFGIGVIVIMVGKTKVLLTIYEEIDDFYYV